MDDPQAVFRIGPSVCRAFADGDFGVAPASLMFGRPPAEELRNALDCCGADPEAIRFGWTCLVIATEAHRVLVDTGGGIDLGPVMGQLQRNLLAAGISPADLDTVVLSHAHPDHIGGAVGPDGLVAFPSARYVMLKDEWDFWTRDPDLHQLRIPTAERQSLRAKAQAILSVLRGRIDLVRDGEEILPGIHAISAPGHTPGSLALRVSSGQEQLLSIGDAVYHPLHVEHPDWSSVYDYDPQMAATTRRRLFDQAARDNSLVHAYHVPYPGLGRVAEAGSSWRWKSR